MNAGQRKAAAPHKTLSLALQMAAEQTLLYGVVLFDAVLAGQLGVDPLAAQIVVARLVEMSAVLFQVTAIGGSILVAQAVGRGDGQEAGLILRSAALLSLAVGFALMLLVQVFSPQLVSLMGVSGAVGQLGTPYLRALALALPLQFLLLGANGCLRGAGDARRPLLVMGLANGLHVLLALLLVFALGAGLTGLALANILMLGLGFLLAALTITGQLTGAGQTGQIYRSALQLQRQAWFVLGGLALLFLAWPSVTRLFSGDELVRAAALPGLQLILLAVPLEAVNQVLTGALRGAGDTRYPMWVTIVGHWLVALPLIVLFTGALDWGLAGVWAAMFLQILLRALATGGRFWRRYHPKYASV